jgi:oxygen-dependent protoporphyrinogen oxidase
VGHPRWVTLVRHLAAGLPPVALAGAAYDGIGVPACIGSGRQAALTLQSTMDGFVR